MREETEGDVEAVTHLTGLAFNSIAGYEVVVLRQLRQTGALHLSLVATRNDIIIAHVAFSPVTINESHADSYFALGPVSVHPDHQR